MKLLLASISFTLALAALQPPIPTTTKPISRRATQRPSKALALPEFRQEFYADNLR